MGGGVVGAAAARALARRGLRTAIFDRYGPANRFGGSHGESRILRLTYEEPVYVEMALRAYGAWARLEEEATVGPLMIETGSWECGPAGCSRLAAVAARFDDLGIAYRRLDRGASERRFPQLRLPPGSEAIFEPRGVVLRAATAVQALWASAAAAGVEMHRGRRLTAALPAGQAIELASADGERWRTVRLVLAAGAWSAELARPLGLELPITATREQVAYFPPASGGDYRPGSMPAILDYHQALAFYAVPQLEATGVKVGWHRSGAPVDPEFPPPERHDPENLARVQAFVADRLPGLQARPARVEPCLYANTPDAHFLLDRHPQQPQIAVATGFSGHGFKFAPVIGTAVAELLLGSAPPVDLTLFRLSRFLEGGVSPHAGA